MLFYWNQLKLILKSGAVLILTDFFEPVRFKLAKQLKHCILIDSNLMSFHITHTYANTTE